jgi:hypothetical protein
MHTRYTEKIVESRMIEKPIFTQMTLRMIIQRVGFRKVLAIF